MSADRFVIKHTKSIDIDTKMFQRTQLKKQNTTNSMNFMNTDITDVNFIDSICNESFIVTSLLKDVLLANENIICTDKYCKNRNQNVSSF